MRKLAILTFLTLDGVMQGPTSSEEDPSGGFAQGGWALPCWDDVMEQVMQVAMAEPYDLLLGRNTYETFAAHFSNSEDDNPVAAKLNNATKYVVSSRQDKPKWVNTERISGDVAKEVTQLKNQNGSLLQVHGSWQLIQTLLAHDLIDEFRLWIFPTVVGNGKRLFDDGVIPTNLELIQSDIGATGAVMHIYRRIEIC